MAAGRRVSVRPEDADTLLVADSLLMREVVVSVAVRPISMCGDTLIYDVASFPLSEGSRLRELLKRLPGVEVTVDGVITAQGRVVNRILLNGRDFFFNNKDVALDNLPVEILTQVKVYEHTDESDEEMGLAHLSTERVIDVTTRPDKDNGWFCDASGGGGTEERYAANFSLSQFNDRWQNMLSASTDNLPTSFGVGDSYYDKLSRTPSTGDTDKRNVNVIVGRRKDAWEVSGSAYYDDWNTETGRLSLMESFLQNERSYTGTRSTSRNRGRSLNTSFILARKDSVSSFQVEPGFYYSRSRYTSCYRSTTYDAVPYSVGASPLTDGLDIPEEHYVNANRNESQDWARSYSATLHSRYNRKLNARGRVLHAELNVETGRNWGEAFSLNELTYYRIERRETSARYIDNPTDNSLLSGRVAYVEPLKGGLKWQMEYGFSYRYQRMNQPVYNLDALFSGVSGPHVGVIESAETFCDSLSRFATNRYWNHRIRVLLQYVHGHLNLTGGVLCNPQRTETSYRKFRTRVDTARSVLNWSPEFSLYYRREDSWNVTLRYSGESAQPDLFYLLPIPDDTDPLNERAGNPGLRPSFTHNLSLSFYHFEVESQRQLSLSLSSQVVCNAMTLRQSYDALTGKRHIMPENINGNRSFNGAWNASTSFRSRPEWYVEFQGEWGWMRRVGLQQVTQTPVDRSASEWVHVTKQVNCQSYVGVQYHRRIVTLKPYAYFSHEGSHSSLDGAPDRSVWLYGYGGVVRCEWSCGLSVAADVYNHSRRGYLDDGLNRDELVCNAEASFSFLKGRAATVRVQACDLFRNQSLTTGSIGLTGRSETLYTHSVNSYLLLTFTYRFSLFGLRKRRSA